MDLEGVHPFVIIERKMEQMMKNYKTSEEIEAELKNVDLGNFLDFDY